MPRIFLCLRFNWHFSPFQVSDLRLQQRQQRTSWAPLSPTTSSVYNLLQLRSLRTLSTFEVALLSFGSHISTDTYSSVHHLHFDWHLRSFQHFNFNSYFSFPVYIQIDTLIARFQQWVQSHELFSKYVYFFAILNLLKHLTICHLLDQIDPLLTIFSYSY